MTTNEDLDLDLEEDFDDLDLEDEDLDFLTISLLAQFCWRQHIPKLMEESTT